MKDKSDIVDGCVVDEMRGKLYRQAADDVLTILATQAHGFGHDFSQRVTDEKMLK